MADFNSSKVDGDSVDANEWNQLASIDNFIATSGQAPSTSNLNQMGIGGARYSSGGQFFTDSGTTNAYVLASISAFKAPVSATEGYFVGMTIKFRAGNANTGASTVNVNSAGVKNLKQADGTTDLAAGDIPTTQDSVFRYNGTSFVLQTGAASTTAKGIVELLTNAELAAGTDTTRAATAAALLSLLTLADVTITNGSFSTATNISSAFGKWILKFGSTPTALNTGVAATITFTNAFPTGCVVALAIPNFSGSASGFQINLVSKAAGNVVFRVDSSSYAGGFSWIAIGY